MQWLPTYLARSLGANKENISLTAVPYFVNSVIGMGNFYFSESRNASTGNYDFEIVNSFNFISVAGHLADSLIARKWTVLSVRRLMTSIGLIGPGIFLLCFCAVNNLWFAVM